MTVEEIFNKLSNRAMLGIQYHSDMAMIYKFLGMYGFAKCHLYHSMEETKIYHSIAEYYTNHYHKLLKITIDNNINLIPENWYKYEMLEVDNNTKRTSIKDLMNKWVQWEIETKKIYSSMRQELYQLGEVAAAIELDKYIKEVSEELKHAEKKLIKLETIGYDLITIIDWQQPMYKKYKKLLGW